MARGKAFAEQRRDGHTPCMTHPGGRGGHGLDPARPWSLGDDLLAQLHAAHLEVEHGRENVRPAPCQPFLSAGWRIEHPCPYLATRSQLKAVQKWCESRARKCRTCSASLAPTGCLCTLCLETETAMKASDQHQMRTGEDGTRRPCWSTHSQIRTAKTGESRADRSRTRCRAGSPRSGSRRRTDRTCGARQEIEIEHQNTQKFVDAHPSRPTKRSARHDETFVAQNNRD